MSDIVVEEWVFPNDNQRKSKKLNTDDTEPEKKQYPQMYVRDYRRQKEDIDEEGLEFTKHRQLGSFRIDGNQELSVSCEANRIEEDLDRICKMNINLMNGYDNSCRIEDYTVYKQKKWQYFLKWIKESQSLDNKNAESDPQFISFAGLFTSLMSTPNKFESWTILVTKYKNCIFMNKLRIEDTFSYKKQNHDRRPDKNPYFTAKATQVMTKSDGQSIKDSVNEREKFFNIFETKIGSHRLLLLSELDAIDDDDNQYSIKCARNLNSGPKWFNWWANSVVSDIDYVMVGVRDNTDVLTQVKQYKVDELEDMFPDNAEPKLSLDFVNRFLNYVKNLLAETEELEVLRVSYRKKLDRVVRCAKQRSMDSIENFLPDWFTSGEEWKQLM